MMLSPENGAETLSRVESVLSAIEPKAPVEEQAPGIRPSEQVLSIRQALFSLWEELPVEQCVGRILANAGIICPPAIPILICGEKITEGAVQALKYYGVTTCRVVCP